MSARLVLVIVTLWLANPSLSVATPHRADKTESEICGANPPHATWLIKNVRNSQEYPGIIVDETQMTLQVHDHPNANDEWQIIFVNKSTSPNPPSVQTLHFIKVCGGSDLPEDLPHPNSAFLDIAFGDIIKKNHNYYIAMGYLDGIPTLALLTLSKAGTGNLRHFNLVFAKVKEAMGTKRKIRQGGVIHGQEN